MVSRDPRLRNLPVALTLLIALGCRREPSGIDDATKIAYAVKPAVVRINAYATARFHCRTDAIRDVRDRMNVAGLNVSARDLSRSEEILETGAGGSGSGFGIHPDGVLMTSAHVIAPTRDRARLEDELRRNGAIAALVGHFAVEQLRDLYRDDRLEPYVRQLASAGWLSNVVVVDEVELSNGEKLPFTIQRYSPPLSEGGADLALLSVRRRNLPTLDIGDSDATRVGESIWAVGYPALASSTDDVIGGWLSRDSDLEATFVPGTITAIKRNAMNVPVFQTNVAIYRGNSGGPAVNGNGEVIGISTWGHKDADQIKFLVPASVARTFIAQAGVTPNVAGDFSKSYRSALDDAVNGRWLSAQRNLAAAQKLLPNAPDLIRFKRDVDRGLRALPFWRLHPVGSGVGAVAAAAVIAGFLTIRSRQKKSSFPSVAVRSDTMVAPGVRGNTAPIPTKGRYSLLGRFTILNGSRAGERLGLGGSGIRIGREQAVCEIVLENPKVSRLHAEVVSIDGKVLLIDRNSSNGTYVNDQRIEKRFLRDGDIIYFGGRNAVAVAFHV
jgi:serine protease Do